MTNNKMSNNKFNIIWSPQPKQIQFMSRTEDEALYGGAAGGGKSDALLAEALRQIHLPHYRAIIFRKTFPQCSELIDRSKELYGAAFKYASYNDNKHCWTFQSGAKIYFGSMQHMDDRTKYQGKRYDFIGFDELTHFSWEEYSYMFSRNRPGGSGARCYIRATCNPGGVGHAWVKERFISNKEPLKTYYEEASVNGKKYVKSRVFIPSNVFDNKILLENDPNYVANLALLPENEKKALLYGDWDSFNGQVFSEWQNQTDHYKDRHYTHVISPFKIPPGWRRFRSFDFGYSRPFSVGWWAMDFDGRVYRYRELYGSTGEPNTGVKWTPRAIAQKIREIEEKYDKGNHITGIADPSIYDISRGAEGSIAAQMEAEGIWFERGLNNRMAGKMQLHYRLSFDGDGLPMLYCFNTCKDFIRTIPSLVYDIFDVEDVNTSCEDHIYDETRYFLMSAPIAPRQNCIKIKEFNPLEDNSIVSDYYGFLLT